MPSRFFSQYKRLQLKIQFYYSITMRANNIRPYKKHYCPIKQCFGGCRTPQIKQQKERVLHPPLHYVILSTVNTLFAFYFKCFFTQIVNNIHFKVFSKVTHFGNSVFINIYAVFHTVRHCFNFLFAMGVYS